MSNMLMKTCSNHQYVKLFVKCCKFHPKVVSFQIRNHSIIQNNKSRASINSLLIDSSNCSNHSLRLVDLYPFFGRRLVSSQTPVISANGTMIENSFVIGSSDPNVTAAIPSSPSSIDLTQFIVKNEPQAVVSMDPVHPLNEPLIDLSYKAMDYIPKAAEIEIISWCPTGWVYEYLCLLHQFFPWWASIAIMTVTFRALLLKFFIDQQRQQVDMSKPAEKMKEIQAKLLQAQRDGDVKESERLYQEVMTVMRQEMFPMQLKMMKTALIQAPIFISTFLVLKNMAYYKIPSLTTGGVLWFTDLSIADPYYLLPILTAASLHLVVRIGAEFGGGLDNQPAFLRNLMMYGFPISGFFLMINFPAALNCYWLTNNLISLIQTFLLTRPPIRKALSIPERKVSKSAPPMPSFGEMLKEVQARQRAAAQASKKSPGVRGQIIVGDKNFRKKISDEMKKT